MTPLAASRLYHARYARKQFSNLMVSSFRASQRRMWRLKRFQNRSKIPNPTRRVAYRRSEDRRNRNKASSICHLWREIIRRRRPTAVGRTGLLAFLCLPSLGDAIQEVGMIHQRQSFESNTVTTSQSCIPSRLHRFTARPQAHQVGRPAINNGISTVETTNRKLAVYLMPDAAGITYLVKRRWQLCVHWFSG